MNLRPFAVICLALALAACANRTPAPQAGINSTASIPAAPRRGEPQDYANMPAAALRVAFGKPAFVRKDGATELWRYDGTACRAFFFLYGDAGAQAVRHVETLPHGAAGASDPGCLAALRAAPAKTS